MVKDSKGGKRKGRNLAQELQKSFEHWEHLNIYGGSDPTWPDGVNMNLTRTHIINDKHRIEESLDVMEYPEIYFKDTPREVDQNYMARADEIRKNAKMSLEIYKNDSNYQFLVEIPPSLSKEEKKKTSIENVIGYVRGLERFIDQDDLVGMRRHERAESYQQTFGECAAKILI